MRLTRRLRQPQPADYDEPKTPLSQIKGFANMIRSSFQAVVPVTLIVFNVDLKNTTSGSIVKVTFGKDVLVIKKVQQSKDESTLTVSMYGDVMTLQGRAADREVQIAVFCGPKQF